MAYGIKVDGGGTFKDISVSGSGSFQDITMHPRNIRLVARNTSNNTESVSSVPWNLGSDVTLQFNFSVPVSSSTGGGSSWCSCGTRCDCSGSSNS